MLILQLLQWGQVHLRHATLVEVSLSFDDINAFRLLLALFCIQLPMFIQFLLLLFLELHLLLEECFQSLGRFHIINLRSAAVVQGLQLRIEVGVSYLLLGLNLHLFGFLVLGPLCSHFNVFLQARFELPRTIVETGPDRNRRLK